MPENGLRPSEGSLELRIAPSASAAAAQVEALLERLEATAEPAERARILVTVGTSLRDDLGDADQAVDALVEALRSDPTSAEALDALEPLLRTTGRWPEALAAVQGAVTAAPSAAGALAAIEILVRWYTREVPQPEVARQWVEQIRKIDTTHSLVHLLDAAVARDRGDFKRELDELDFAVLSAKRADDRARIHLLMAARYCEDRTRDLAQAKKHYEAARRLFPRQMEALLGLEQLAVWQDDKRALADVLREQAEADLEPAARVDVLLRLARLEEEEFRRPEDAARTLERVIDLHPDHEAALDALERCYRSARAWHELASVLERGAAAAADPAARAERLKRLGDVLESKLGDLRAAVATYGRLAASMPDDAMVLGELARLAEKVGDVDTAVRCRVRLAEIAPDAAARARMFVIAGQLLLPTDAAAARRQFERAVEADSSSVAAWNALLWDARAEGDAVRALRYLEDRAARTDTPRARASAYIELAEARQRAGDAAGARAAYEAAAEADPHNESAAAALAEAFVSDRRYAEAEALCEVAIPAAERDRDYERLFALRCAQARAAEALGKPDRALAAALAAHEVKPDAASGKEALVTAAASMRADPQVLSAIDALVALAERPDGLSVDRRVDLADVLATTGHGEHAAALYDSVLAEEPEHERALSGLSQHHTAAGNPVAALRLRRQIARGVVDAAERFAALVEVAEAFANKAKDDALAAEVYEEARAVRPADLPVLHKLLAAYQRLGRWPSVFDVLRSIAEADADPVRKAKTLFTMAQIAKGELADRGGALALFDQVLDVDPSQLTAFERIVAMLTEDKDWLGLEQMYKKMLTRALGGADAKLQHALYTQVALVYRDRIGRSDLAIQALQAAVHLRPDDEQAQTMLRELLARTGQAGGAVAVTLDRILREPLDPAPYPALFDLLVGQGARDRAACVASAMRFLGVAHAAADGLRAAYPQPPIEGIVMDLGAEGYRDLLHPELDPALTEIFEVVAPALVDILVSRLPLRERLGHPGPALKGYDWLGKLLSRAAHVLGAPAPRLYLRRAPGPALGAAPTRPPSLLCYPHALGGVSREVLTFVCGKRVLELTPPAARSGVVPLHERAQGAGRVGGADRRRSARAGRHAPPRAVEEGRRRADQRRRRRGDGEDGEARRPAVVAARRRLGVARGAAPVRRPRGRPGRHRHRATVTGGSHASREDARARRLLPRRRLRVAAPAPRRRALLTHRRGRSRARRRAWRMTPPRGAKAPAACARAVAARPARATRRRNARCTRAPALEAKKNPGRRPARRSRMNRYDRDTRSSDNGIDPYQTPRFDYGEERGGRATSARDRDIGYRSRDMTDERSAARGFGREEPGRWRHEEDRPWGREGHAGSGERGWGREEGRGYGEERGFRGGYGEEMGPRDYGPSYGYGEERGFRGGYGEEERGGGRRGYREYGGYEMGPEERWSTRGGIHGQNMGYGGYGAGGSMSPEHAWGRREEDWRWREREREEPGLGERLRRMGEHVLLDRDEDRRWREEHFGREGSGRGRERGGEEPSLWDRVKGVFAGKGPKNYVRSDDRIREDVSERICYHPYIDASDVEVQVKDAEVTLTGEVDDRRTKRLLEDVAEDVRGVRDVHNRVRVRRQPHIGATGQTQTSGTTAGTAGAGGQR